jgi:hypothetical protein
MPGLSVGNLGIADLLEVRFLSAEKFGLDAITQILAADMAIHNSIMTDMVKTFADVTQDIQRLYGAGDVAYFSRVDEYGRAHTQKRTTGSAVGFPLNRFQVAVGWTADYLSRATPADLAQKQQAVQRGHALQVRSELQAAIYGATNFTFLDYLVRNFSIGVKRFVNADGAPIPTGPNGEVFNPSTHTHYLAGAALTGALADSLVSTVAEHHMNGTPQVFINAADEVVWRALANFKPYIDSRLTLNANANQPYDRLNPFLTNNRPIGLYGAAEVWVKPWAVSGYAACMDTAIPNKPLACRLREGGTNQITLATAAEIVGFPLQAQYMQSEYGFGVWTRTNGAVLDFGHGSYTDPAALVTVS